MQTDFKKNKKILLIITGSIAAYKTIDLARSLEEKGHRLTIIITQGGQQFVTPLSFAALTKADVVADDIFNDDATEVMQHIELSRQHDLIMVAPATADFIAKVVCGFADTLALSTLLAAQTKIIIAPAMNPYMWENKATKDNLLKLKERGFVLAEPISGVVACGDEGIGKYIGNDELLIIIEKHFTSKPVGKLKGMTAVVTIGATHEKIDPVRYIGNSSSGYTGSLIAKRLLESGCKVHVIAGYINAELPENVILHRAYTADEMKIKSEQLLPCDIYIGCAAICDYKPTKVSISKIKKSEQPLKLNLELTTDVLAHIGGNSQRPKLVIGFALESENAEQNAIQKLYSKGLDIIICNKVKHLGEDFNEYSIITKKSKIKLGTKSKAELANLLVTEISKYFSSQK